MLSRTIASLVALRRSGRGDPRRHTADHADWGELSARDLLVAAVLHRERKGLVEGGGPRASIQHVSSGAPQMAAAGSRSWDVGGTGSAPATLGAQRFDILTIGITNDGRRAMRS